MQPGGSLRVDRHSAEPLKGPLQEGLGCVCVTCFTPEGQGVCGGVPACKVWSW